MENNLKTHTHREITLLHPQEKKTTWTEEHSLWTKIPRVSLMEEVRLKTAPTSVWSLPHT